MLDTSGCVTLSARLQDRFGDYGLISAICCDIQDRRLAVREFVMSCRVLKRGVEEYLINYLFNEARKRGLVGVVGELSKAQRTRWSKTSISDSGLTWLQTTACDKFGTLTWSAMNPSKRLSEIYQRDIEMTKTEILSKLTGIFRDVFDDETLVARPEMTAHEVDRWD
jgi:predicted enzyme involved in methoxymalonyl-ACP biosynthesis